MEKGRRKNERGKDGGRIIGRRMNGGRMNGARMKGEWKKN